jgi:hypothetical protein
MPRNGVVIAAALCIVLVVVASMAALHESHYRERRGRLLAARLHGLELRLAAIEEILGEDRLT